MTEIEELEIEEFRKYLKTIPSLKCSTARKAFSIIHQGGGRGKLRNTERLKDSINEVAALITSQYGFPPPQIFFLPSTSRILKGIIKHIEEKEVGEPTVAITIFPTSTDSSSVRSFLGRGVIVLDLDKVLAYSNGDDPSMWEFTCTILHELFHYICNNVNPQLALHAHEHLAGLEEFRIMYEQAASEFAGEAERCWGEEIIAPEYKYPPPQYIRPGIEDEPSRALKLFIDKYML